MKRRLFGVLLIAIAVAGVAALTVRPAPHDHADAARKAGH